MSGRPRHNLPANGILFSGMSIMRFGPVHLIKDSTYRTLEGRVLQSAKIQNALVRDGFMHVGLNIRTAPGVVLEPDDPNSPRAKVAVDRVVRAYHRAMSDHVAPQRGLWDKIEGSSRKAEFFEALRRGDRPLVGQWLARMFQTDLIWGLGRFHEAMPADMRTHSEHSLIQNRCTDALVSLAQAVGARPVVSLQHQGVDPYLNELNVDLTKLLAKIEQKTALDLSAAHVGGIYGCHIGNKLITIDDLLQSHTVHRLRQLGADRSSRIVEIGGGFGGLARLAYRADHGCYEVFDLPWVNVLQGYFLLMSLPPETVRLYGEDRGEVRISPHWCFANIAGRSVDYVVNTDSLPEMALAVRTEYISQIRRILRGYFLSINQESGIQIDDFDPQGPVGDVVTRDRGFRLLSRNRWWMCQGYVEEVFAPL
jgi:putative sugar O-methyltransferase